jgi:outer membrane protein TolC
MLAAWKTAVKQSGQQVDLAQKDRYPDFAVGLAYTQRNELQNGMPGYDFVSAMFNVKIPLFYNKKQDKKVQETRIRQSSVEYRYRNVANSVEQMLQQTLTNLEKQRRLVDLYQTGIIPQAEESLESSMAGYQNDKVDFLSLLDSELTLFEFRLDYHRFVADYHKAVAELEALTGTDL